ncbi:MAG: diaminopimelate decarboxylase [Spirochaetaceae bacterium]|jgi:diaminopimelate decarboxylase|nr:diaminopimelate decarboxylase [Spirochaetaceae bacterium]
MTKKTFPLSKTELERAAKEFITPFYIYDEEAIRKNARRINAAFSIFPSYINYFAVKAMPNPVILNILREEGFGADCSSLTELLLADMSGIKGENIMFTSNETPAAEYRKARELGAVINLDDITHIEFLEKTAGLPEMISIRYNPGPLKMGNSIIGNPVEAKYGFTREQTLEGFTFLKKKGVKRFALHTMVASNELNTLYHIETGRLLFELAAEIKQKTGISLEFVNLGGGVGIPYKPEDEAVNYEELTAGLKKIFDAIMVPAGLGNTGIHTEWGRAITGPYGWLITRAIHRKDTYRKYIGVDASMADLMRPAMYGAYHHISVAGKEDAPPTEIYDVVGSLCENCDKFAVQRKLPAIETDEISGDLLIIHDAGAHGRAMGFNYNGKLRCGELILRADGGISRIRRKETPADLFATLV